MYIYASFKNSSKIFVLICYKDACGRLGELKKAVGMLTAFLDLSLDSCFC